MNCFYHPQTVALAMCKHCGRGICADCAAEVGLSMACKNRCEAEVKAIDEIMQRAKTAYQKTSGVYFRNAIYFLLAGIIFVAFGLAIELGPLNWLIVPMGGVCLLSAILQFSSARKFSRKD